MFFDKIKNYVYPNVCGICEKIIKYNTYTCTNCLSILKYYKEKHIRVCASNNFDELLSLYEYKGVIKKKICKLKFRDGKYIANSFAYLLSKRIKELNMQFDIIIPVPISIKRKLVRGYNQSNLITMKMAKILKKESNSKILIKFKHNKKQSDLNENDRKNNVIGVYKVKNECKIKNKIVLLVDDVCTTGATLNECAKMLKRSGAKKVIALTIAHA